MKYLFTFAVLACIGLVSCKNSDEQSVENGKQPRKVPVSLEGDVDKSMDSSQLTSVKWLDSLVDFGAMKDGQTKEVMFRYKNTGDKDLIIQNVVAGCGCTVPEYTRTAVAPGKEGFVKAMFNSAGQPPTVHKTISVTMNTPELSYTLAFIGEVKK